MVGRNSISHQQLAPRADLGIARCSAVVYMTVAVFLAVSNACKLGVLADSSGGTVFVTVFLLSAFVILGAINLAFGLVPATVWHPAMKRFVARGCLAVALLWAVLTMGAAVVAAPHQLVLAGLVLSGLMTWLALTVSRQR